MRQPLSILQPRHLLPAIALSLLSLSATLPALTQEARHPMLRTLTVTGQGREPVMTSMAQINLGIEVQGKTAEEVQAAAAKRSSAVVEFLKAQRVEKLQTTGINLSPRYTYSNGNQRLDGFSASNTVSFRVPTDKAGPLMDAAVKTGATRIDGISFIASDEAIAAARREALKEATQQARTEADIVLSSLNLSAQEIVGIQVDSAPTPPRPFPVPMALGKMAEAAASTPVVGGEQEVQASVTLQIRY